MGLQVIVAQIPRLGALFGRLARGRDGHSRRRASPLGQVRNKLRVKHYSLRTEQAYCDWIKRFIHYPGKRHPAAMGAAEVEAFLTHLPVDGRVAASTPKQAKAALLFLYREVLAVELPWLENVQKATEAGGTPPPDGWSPVA